MKIWNKKGQEESMGFVVIIMLVLVVGIVFLGFSLRQNKTVVQQQQELSDMTWAVLSYTTNCTISGEAESIWDLSKECDITPSQTCDVGADDVCVVLNKTLYKVLTSIIGTNASITNRYVHAYEFNIVTGSGKTSVKQGNRTGNYFTYLTFIPKDINVTAKFYYSG